MKTSGSSESIISELLEHNILGGLNLEENRLLVCCTEQNSIQDIEDYVSLVK